MSSLVPSPRFCALLGQSRQLSGCEKPLRVGGFRGFGDGAVALSPFGFSGCRLLPEQIGNGRCRKVFSLSEDLEEADVAVEGVGEGESVVNSRGRGFILSFLSNSVTTGVLALTVAAVAVVLRSRRSGFVATAAEVGQVCMLNEERVSSPNEILIPVSAFENEVFSEP